MISFHVVQLGFEKVVILGFVGYSVIIIVAYIDYTVVIYVIDG